MRMSIDSRCGCGFTVEGEDRSATVTLRSHDTTVVRHYDDLEPREVRAVIDFVLSVAVAVESDQEVGVIRDNFCDPSYHSEVLGLESRLDLVSDSNSHLRGTFTLLSAEGDSLDYCHVSVTVDVSLTQLLDDTRAAAATDSHFSF